MACMFISANSLAGNYTWTGATSSNWGVSTNWSPAGTPGASDSITINSTSTNLVLTTKQTVKRLTINSDTLDLGGDTLEITGSAAFSGGKINNGVCYPQCTGLLNFNSTTFGAEVKAKGQIKLNGCIFNNAAFFEHVGSAAGTGMGGNTFNGTTTLKNIGTSSFRIGTNYNDTFNGDAYLISVSNNIIISFGAHTYFNGNVEFSSSNIYGINVGGSGNGYTYLATGKTITSGGSGIVGSFVLRNFIQYGSTAQSFTSLGSLNMTGCVFNGNLSCSSQGLLLSGNEFHGTSSFTKTGSSSDFSAGGNHFYGAATFTNNATNTAAIRLASTSGDMFDTDVVFNTNTGQIQVGYSDTTDFKGHISSNNSAKVTFGTGGGYSNFIGLNEQIVSGTGEYVFSRMIVNKTTSTVTLQKPIKVDTLLVLQNGIIKGDSANKVTVGLAGSITGMSPQNYIEAAVLKIGNTAFTFPVGDSGEYRPITMSAPTVATDKFEAQYFKQQQGLSTTLDTGLNYISTCNYWRFERIYGSSSVSFTTNWYEHSCDVFDVDSTKLAGYQSGVWKNLGLVSHTGNDSHGSITYSGAISGYKYFALGHQLFPRVEFQAFVDSTAFPVVVTFVNKSYGFPPNTYYFMSYGDSLTGNYFSDIRNNKNSFIHSYNNYKSKDVVLFAVFNNDTISYTYKLLLSALTIQVELLLDPSDWHPTTSPLPSACYDHFKLRFHLGNVANDVTGPEITLNLSPPPILGTITSTTFSSSSNDISVNSTAASATFDYTGTGSLSSCVWDVNFEVTNCDLFDQLASLINIDFQLDISSNMDLALFSSTPGSPIQINTVPPYIDLVNFSLTNISKPQVRLVEITSGSELSHNNENFIKLQTIERYYDLKPQSGISDMFTVAMEVEKDAKMSKIEVVIPGSSTPLLTLFDNSIVPLMGNDVLKIVFYDSNRFPAIVPTSLPVTSHGEVLVPISQCVSPTANNLYNENGISNFIRVHETLYLDEVSNCNNFDVHSTTYAITQNCNKDYSIMGCNETKPTLDANCTLNSPVIRCTLKHYDLTSGYTDITNHSISPCPATIYPPNSNLTILIKNDAPISYPASPIGSGTAELHQFSFKVSEYLEYDDLLIGSKNIGHKSPDPGTGYISIDFITDLGGDNPNFSSNPDGLESFYSDHHPISNDFIFLPPGHSIGITLTNPRVIECALSSYDLDLVNHSLFYLIGERELLYDDMCTMTEIPDPGPYADHDHINKSIDDIELSNRFSGIVTGTANPQFVTTNATQSTLKFKFDNNTAQGSTADTHVKFPWQVLNKHLTSFYDIIDCPTISNYAYLNVTPFVNGSYKVISATVTDNVTNISTVVTPTILSPNDWKISFPAGSFDVTVEAVVEVTCSGAGFGFDDFTVEFRSECVSAACSSCTYITYGGSFVSLYRHCYGNCPPLSYASTKNFSMDRTSRGWTTEQAYLSGIPANASQDPNVTALHRVYPCDHVKVLSTEGGCGIITNGIKSGVPNLAHLYFDILFDDQKYPFIASPFNFSAQPNSHFTITPQTGPIAHTPIVVPIVFPLNSWHPSGTITGMQPGVRVYRIPVNVSQPLSSTPYANVLDLLNSEYCDIAIEAELEVDDISGAIATYYDIWHILGEFNYDYYNGTAYETVESCDAWSDNLMYLKIIPSIETDFSGPVNPFIQANQCQAIYSLVTKVVGGMPKGVDDFYNEYRPAYIIPSVIDFSHDGHILRPKLAVLLNSNYQNIHTFNVSSQPNSIHVTANAGFNGAVNKGTDVMRTLIMAMDRNCSVTSPPINSIPSPHYLSSITDFESMFVNSCNSSIVYTKDFDDVTIPNTPPPPHDEYLPGEFTCTFTSSSPWSSPFIPNVVPIGVQFVFMHSPFTTYAPNSWVYFECSDPATGITYTLKDKTTQIPIPSYLSTTHGQVFLIGDILKSVPKNFDLFVDWSQCPSSGNFVITAHYGTFCRDITLPINIDNIIDNTCVAFQSNAFEIAPWPSELSVHNVSNPIPSAFSNCDRIGMDYKIASLDGDLNTASFLIDIPSGLNIDYSLSYVEIVEGSNTPSPITYTAQLPPAVVNSQNNLEWDILDILTSAFTNTYNHFNQDSDPNYIIFHIEYYATSSQAQFDIAYQATGLSKCGESANTEWFQNLLNYSGTPADPVVFQSTGSTICNGSAISISVLSPMGTYSWSTGATTQGIVVNSGGNYIVTVTYPYQGTTCTTNGVYQVLDLSPQVALTANDFCTSVGVTTISNTTDDLLYSYSWSTGSTSHTVDVYSAGTYTVTVTLNGCSTTQSITINDITPSAVINYTSLSYCSPQAVILSSASIGTSYLWSSGQTTSSISVTPGVSTSYFLTVTNNGCSATSSAVQIDNITPFVSIMPSVPLGQCPPDNMTLSVQAGHDTYLWSNGSTTNSMLITGQTSNQTYTVTVTDNGCTAQASIIVPYVNLTVSISASNPVYCPPLQTVTLTALPSPPAGTQISYSYQWSSGGTASSISPVPVGNQTYTVTVTNLIAGCTAISQYTIDNIAPPLSIVPNPAIGCTGDIISLTANSSSGCSYLWSDGMTSNSNIITALDPPSSLNLTVTDPATGCENYGQVSGIGITPVLSGTTTVNSPSSGSTVYLTVTNSNNYNSTYAWYNQTTGTLIQGITSATCSVNPASTNQYQVEVTNTDPVSGLRCTTYYSFVVIVPSVPPSITCDPSIPEIKPTSFNVNSSGMFEFNAVAGMKYAINYDLTIGPKMILNVGAGAQIVFADNVGLKVLNGGILYIEYGGVLKSCNHHMWSGISVDNQSTVFLTGTATIPLEIEDAYIGFNASGPNSNIHINGSVVFNANNIGVFLHGGDFPDIKFEGTKFTCNKLLNTPYNGRNYSFVHLRLDNAGTVNLNRAPSGPTYSCYFEDAMYCIESRKTNLLIEHCSFEQSNLSNWTAGKDPTAVYFEGDDGTNPNALYTLNAGKINSTFGKNHFSDCYWGIKTHGRAMINITNNEFYGVRYGIGAGGNALSFLPNKSGSLHINHNQFYTSIENAIDIFNNGNVFIEVGYNEINFTQAFDPDFETNRGIYVHNAVDPANDNSNLNISYNKIKNCRTGIQIMQQSRGVIGTNDIIYELEDSYLNYTVGVFRRGIRAQNTSGLTFLNNTVWRRPASGQTYNLMSWMIDNDPQFLNGTLTCGISEEFSNNDYNSNHIFDMPTQIKVFGPCLGSTFLCNDMNNGLEGFKIEPTWIPGSATSISNQGSQTSPNGNTWNNWPSISSGLPVSKINGVIPGFTGITWFYGNTPDQDPTFDGVTGVLQIPSGLAIQNLIGDACIPCPECAIDRIYAAIAEADSLDIDEAIQFVLRSYAYRELKDSLQLLYSGSVYEIELQNFFNAMGLNNVGLLSNIEELLASNDYANAALYNSDIITDRLVETNLETVNRICASYEMRFDNLDSLDRAELETIAYQNPSIGGVAVYRARAILGIDIEDSYLAFRRPKSESNVNSIRLVPNPTSGKFTVFTSSQDVKILEIKVYNNVGQLVEVVSGVEGTSFYSLDLSNRPDGTYFIKSKLDNGTVMNNKLIVIKN